MSARTTARLGVPLGVESMTHLHESAEPIRHARRERFAYDAGGQQRLLHHGLRRAVAAIENFELELPNGVVLRCQNPSPRKLGQRRRVAPRPVERLSTTEHVIDVVGPRCEQHIVLLERGVEILGPGENTREREARCFIGRVKRKVSP